MNQLHDACERGDVEEVTSLLSNEECDINAHNMYGESPLHIACEYCCLEIVKVLLKDQKCDLNIQNSYGNTPLHLACDRLSFDIIEFLLERRCNTNIPNKKGETAQYIPLNEDGDYLLHIACQWGDVGIVRYLITDERCNPNVQSSTSKNTPLHIAAKYGQDDVIVQLLSYKECDPNAQNCEWDTPLHIACCRKSLNIIKSLLQIRCSTNISNKKGLTAQNIALNEEGDYLLHVACQWGDVDIVKYLIINERCNPDVQNILLNTPLHIACHMKSLSIIRLLLDRRCSINIPNKKGLTAQNIALNDGDYLLHVACQWGDVGIVKYLIIERCDPNVQSSTSKNTPLHVAAKYGEKYMIAQLLSSNKCNPNAQNKEGDTPLHFAVRHNEAFEISQLLYYQQSNPNAQNREGDTPLHIACHMRVLHSIILLLKRRCNTNIPNKKGETAQYIPLNEDGDYLLHIACQWDDVGIVRYLITDERCNPNVQSSTSKNTPLHIAAKYGQDDVIVQLLSYKECDPNAQNCEWDTPLHIACCRKSLNIIKSLLQIRCSTNISNKKGLTAQNIALNEEGDYLLHVACQWGDVDIVKYLIINERCNPDVQNILLNTPLHIACHMKSLSIIRLLLDRRCSINIPNKKGLTAQNIALNEEGDYLLHVACQWGDVDIVKYLIINERCNPDVQNILLNTPLHIACHMKSLSIIRLLLDRRCSINIPNKKGLTAQNIALNEEGDYLLHVACQWGDVDIVKYLIINERCNPDVQNILLNTPLHIACHMKSLNIIRLLLDRRCSINIPNKKGLTAQNIALNDGDYLLHIACQWGDVGIVRYLITDERCNPNVQSSTSKNTPLHIAAKYGQDDVIVQLLSYKECDPNAQNCEWDTPLHIACCRKSLNIIKSLLQIRCSTNISNKKGLTAQNIALNEEGDYLLHVACQWGDVDIVKYLIINERCNPDVQNILLNTPLHIACHMKSLSIIRLLLDRRCSINIPNKKGLTAQNIALNDGDYLLHVACQWGDVGIVKYLIIERCDPNVQSSTSKNTPLHVAAKYGEKYMIAQLLSSNKCNPNAQNKEGDTPLHFAVRHNEAFEISQLLYYQQSNPNAQNREGDTPLHIACHMRVLHSIILLLKRRCNTNIPNKKGETAQYIPLNEDGDYLLHIACQWDDVGIVRYLITDERCNPNVQSSTSKNTPLHIAAKYGQDDVIVQLLSYKECDPNAQNCEWDTPLHIACCRKSLNIIKSLLQIRCSTNISNKKDLTAQNIALNEEGDYLLHVACQWGDVDIVKYLIINERCNPDVQNILLNTPLHIACHMKSLSIIRLLLDRRCSINIPNKKGLTAQNIALNEEGDYLLHVACQWGDVDIVKYLIINERCNPDVQNILLNTPLHIACHMKSLNIIRLLLDRRCSINIPNKKGLTAQNIALNDGDYLLHVACQWGDVGIVKYLIIERCDPNVQSSTSKNTPLHVAAKYGEKYMIAQLLSSNKCNPNAQNKEGDTPLHFAVRHSEAFEISQLLDHQQSNPNAQNREGDTPLHIACHMRVLHFIMLLLKRRCNTNIPNKKGETAQYIPLNEDGDYLLHIACQWGDVGIVRYLITDERCNPNVQCSTSKNTPLHIAAKYGQDDVIVQLLSYKKCDPNILNKYGDTPLHVAVRNNITPMISRLLQHNPNVQNYVSSTLLHVAARKNRLPAISQLLSNKQCNPNVVNNDHLTPLLIAVQHNNSLLATALLQHDKCDPTLRDQHGNTPLHLACIGGETQPEMVEVAKQLLMSVDPSCVNNAGQTPIELTTNYQLIQAISQIIKCKTKQSVQTYISMFIVGNPETGKSTLVKAIRKEASILWKIVPKQMRRVKNVPLHTAGIIPTTFQSKEFGNTILYDLAGQVEYYTSHAAVIQSTVISTPPAFILVVNLNDSEEKISQTLRYWWSFIDNHAARSSAPPEVILVGSHADIVKSTGGNVDEKMTDISALLKKLPASFHFAGQVALDCRDPASRKLQDFCSLVNQSCTVLRQTADVDLRCHVLYAFLLDRFKDNVACTVSDLAASIKETSALLPQKLDTLVPLISTLSNKGLLLLVKSGESFGGWWIILQKQALLGEINGVIFAPKSFKQHKDLSWSTGVVPFFKLKNEFPDYNPNMVFEFLTHLEFCFKIEDHQTLALLKDEAANMEDTYPDISDEYYFFPALVSVENPLHVWKQNDKMCCTCGWFYHCIRPDQFLTTQFLHVLILRLAFTFALKLDTGDCCEDSFTLRRKCSVWKHGIAWLNGVPIETVVEVGLQFQSVVVIMRCPEGKEAKCAELRLKVVQKVLEAKDEHCKAVKMSESLIHPTDAKYPFTNNIEDVKFYSLTAIARSTVSEEEALDHRGRNPVPVQDLLLFDPYSSDTSTELLSEHFGRKHSMDEEMRRQVLETLNSK